MSLILTYNVYNVEEDKTTGPYTKEVDSTIKGWDWIHEQNRHPTLNIQNVHFMDKIPPRWG